MGSTDSTAAVERTGAANLDLVRGLREVADWLEQHPGLPAAQYAVVSFGYSIKLNAREQLTQLAQALGERAKESRYRDSVNIDGQFGPMKVHADTTVRALVDAPPEPTDYEPILGHSPDPWSHE